MEVGYVDYAGKNGFLNISIIAGVHNNSYRKVRLLMAVGYVDYAGKNGFAHIMS